MTKPVVVFPDAERATVELLEALIADYEPEVTVSVGVPKSWDSESASHIQVAWDGTPTGTHPIVEHATIRLVARAQTTTEAKRLVDLARGLLLAHDGTGDIIVVRRLTGVLPARDTDSNAELASVTLRVTVRSEPALAS